MFVTDDASESALLRERIATSLRSFDARSLDAYGSCNGPFDPAAWHPVDLTAIVVRPSATGTSRFVTPLDDPHLRWQSHRRTDADAAQFASAVESALVNSQAPSGALAPILQTFDRVWTLLGGTRAAETAEDDKLMRSIVPGSFMAMVLASARDDGSPQAATTYAINERYAGNVFLQDIVAPSRASEPGRDCRTDPQDPEPRFAEWLRASNLSAFAKWWPCENLEVLEPISSSCRTNCLPWRPIIDATGTVECRIEVEARDLDACPAELGWLDPLGDDGQRRAVATTLDNHVQRTCEIAQLDGAQLEECRHTLDCADCGPGWCFTEVAELQSPCPSNTSSPAFRFIGGAAAGVRAKATLVCNVTLL